MSWGKSDAFKLRPKETDSVSPLVSSKSFPQLQRWCSNTWEEKNSYYLENQSSYGARKKQQKGKEVKQEGF